MSVTVTGVSLPATELQLCRSTIESYHSPLCRVGDVSVTGGRLEQTQRPGSSGRPDLAELRRVTGADLIPMAADDPLRAGTWEILARFQHVGMARVYLGRRSTEPGGLVVVKLLAENADAADPERLAREVRNARLVADRGFVAQVLDFVPVPAPFLVQEFIAGPTLDWLMKQSAARPPEERIRTAQAFSIASGLLQALASVHEASVVHRDLKPRNVILHSIRGPVLIDFGISHHTDDPRLTGVRHVIGTPQFMSPERLRGGGDAKADIFAWGIIIAMLMQGYHPFDREGRLTTGAEYELAIDTMSPDLSGVPQAYRQVLSAALRPAPGRRPTASQLITRMDAIARSPKEGLDPLAPAATRQDWLAPARAFNPAQFMRALLDIRSSSADRSEQDRRELLRAARSSAERLAVRIHYHPRSPVFARRPVWLLVVGIAAMAGLVAGTVVVLTLDVLWNLLT